MTYKVGIIGAGSIGALKPDNIDGPNTEIPLTHAHAIFFNADLEIRWIYDTDPDMMKAAISKWNRDYPISPIQHERIFTKGAINDKAIIVDIIVVSCPTEYHLSWIEKICTEFKYKPKIIILEKPAGIGIHEATRIDYLCRQAGICVAVNYTRRYIPIIQKAMAHIKKSDIQSIIFYYTRGMIRDGSHAIDIFNWIAGIFQGGSILPTPPIIDYSKNDPTYGAVLHYSMCPNIFLIPCDGNLFDIFEMQVITDKSRWIFGDHFRTIYQRGVQKEEIYGNYSSLPLKGEFKKGRTRLEMGLTFLYEEIVALLNKETLTIPCGMREALRIHNVIDKMLIMKDLEEREARGEV